jgi:hypothetical protein
MSRLLESEKEKLRGSFFWYLLVVYFLVSSVLLLSKSYSILSFRELIFVFGEELECCGLEEGRNI